MASKSNDLPAGLLCMAVGGAFAVYAKAYLNMGTMFRMGAGYFPFLLACLLVLIGLGLAVRALGKGVERPGNIPWRGVVCLTLAPVVFGLALDPLGFVAAVFLVVIISTFASKDVVLVKALLFSIGMTVLCVGIFYYGLSVPVQLLGTWITG